MILLKIFLLQSFINTGDNYYSGSDSNFWSDLAIQIIATGLTFWGAYKIFRWQVKNEREINKEKEIEANIALIKFVSFSLGRSLNGAKRQILYLDKFIEETSIKDFKLSMKISAKANFDWVNSVDMISFRKLFFEHYGRNAEDNSFYFAELLDNLNLLRLIQGKLEPNYTEFRERVNKYSEEYDHFYNQFAQKMDKVFEIGNQKYDTGPFLIELDKLSRDFRSQDVNLRNVPSFKYYYFISGVKQLCLEYKINEFKEIYNPLQRSYKYLEATFTQNLNQFNQTNRTLKYATARLNVINRKLNQQIKHL